MLYLNVPIPFSMSRSLQVCLKYLRGLHWYNFLQHLLSCSERSLAVAFRPVVKKSYKFLSIFTNQRPTLKNTREKKARVKKTQL